MTDHTTSERRTADRLQERADALKTEYERLTERSSGMYGRFSGGQPLLIGHHSYRGAVRDRDRADNATRAAIEKGREAERAQQNANAAKRLADLADIEAARSRPWQREDFRKGDIAWYRNFRRDMGTTSRGRVKRVNAKTLTIDGGGGGMDDPKAAYDRVLSRTRDGVTVTDPAKGEA